MIGKERYAQVPDQVIRYVLGRFGRPARPVDPDVMDEILAQPRADEIRADTPFVRIVEEGLELELGGAPADGGFRP